MSPVLLPRQTGSSRFAQSRFMLALSYSIVLNERPALVVEHQEHFATATAWASLAVAPR